MFVLEVLKIYSLKLIVDKLSSCIFYRKVCKVAGGIDFFFIKLDNRLVPHVDKAPLPLRI